MPKRGRAAASPKPWRRVEGVYRSDDDRYTLEGGGGRWFVTDHRSLDELGLARTLGPYDTLDDAKAAATARREIDAEASPFAGRIAAAKDRPPTPATRARPPSAKAAPPGPAPERDREPSPPESPVPGRTWLDELADADPPEARRAARLVDALGALGIEDPDGLVRRDVLGRQPAVAARLVGRALAAALGEQLDPASLDRDARRVIPDAMRALHDADEAALAAYAAFVASRVLDASLRVLAVDDRADGAGRDLPGWRLMERPAGADPDAAARRLIVTPDDVPEG